MQAGGQLEAVQKVELKCRVSGQLINVHCRPGQMVKKGQVLFEIDPRPFRVEADKAEAELARPLAHTRLPAKLSNFELLQKKGFKGPEDVAKLKDDIEVAGAALQTAEANLELAKLKLESTKVTSPIVGKISGSVLAIGNVAVADTTVLTTILSYDPIYVSFSVDEGTLMRLKSLIRDGQIKVDQTAGYPVVVYRFGDDFKCPAKVDLGDVVVQNQGGHIVAALAALVPNPDGFLLPGLIVNVKLTTSAPYVVRLLPVEDESVSQVGPNGLRIYVVNSENVVEARDVRSSGQYDGRTAFDAGLKTDEWVVIERIDDEFVGKKVEPVRVSLPRKRDDDKLPALLTPADRARLRVPIPDTTPEGQRAKP